MKASNIRLTFGAGSRELRIIGKFKKEVFYLNCCPSCVFSHISNLWLVYNKCSRSFSERFLRWQMLACIVGKVFEITAHPIAWAEEADARHKSTKKWFLPGKTLS
jgi:hypothetical protein